MQQIKKHVAIGGAIIMAACWPLAVGQIAQNVLTDGVAQLGNDKISAEVIEYQRGYFSAQAKTRFSVTDPALKGQLEQDGLPTQIELTHQIDHGLLSISAETETLVNPLLAFRLDTQTKLNGNTAFDFHAEPIQFKDAAGAELNIDHYNGQGQLTLGGVSEFRFEVPSMEVKFANGELLEVDKLVLKGNGQKQQGFWLGKQSIRVQGVELKTHDPAQALSLEKMRYTISAHQDEAGEKLTSKQKILLTNLTMANAQVDSARFDFSVRDMNRGAFSGLMALYQQNQVLNDEQIAEAIPLLDTLVESGLTVSLDQLVVKLDKGTMNIDWQLGIPAGLKNVSQNPTMILNQLTGHLTANTSNELLEVYPTLQEGLDELMILEFASTSPSGYQLGAKLENGMVKFETGKEVALMALFLPLLANGQ